MKMLSSLSPDQGSRHLFAELKMGKELALPLRQGECRRLRATDVCVLLLEAGSVGPKASPGTGELLTPLHPLGFGNSVYCYVEIIVPWSRQHHMYPRSAAVLARL